MFTATGKYAKNLNKVKVSHNGELLDSIVAKKGTEEGYNEVYSKVEHLGAIGGRAFTITFTDAWLLKYRMNYLYTTVVNEIMHTRGVKDHVMVPEISEAGRFHLHGVIACKDLASLSNVRRKMTKYGMVKVKVITNSKYWANYVMKQKDLKIGLLE